MYIKDWKARGEAVVQVLEQAALKAGLDFEKAMAGMLVQIDTANAALLMKFRLIYGVYASQPCGENGYLERETSRLLREEHVLRRLEVESQHLALLAKEGVDGPALQTAIQEAVKRIALSEAAREGAVEFKQVKNRVDRWEDA